MEENRKLSLGKSNKRRVGIFCSGIVLGKACKTHQPLIRKQFFELFPLPFLWIHLIICVCWFFSTFPLCYSTSIFPVPFSFKNFSRIMLLNIFFFFGKFYNLNLEMPCFACRSTTASIYGRRRRPRTCHGNFLRLEFWWWMKGVWYP